MMDRKGSIGDIFYILFVVTLCAFVFVIGWVAMSKVNDVFQAQPDIAAAGKTIMQNSTDKYVGHLDGIFMTIFVVLYIGALILASQIDAHPLYFILSIIVFGVLVLITAVFSNAYWEFANNAGIIDYANDFTIIPFVMNNMVATFVVMAFGLAGVIYAKTR